MVKDIYTEDTPRYKLDIPAFITSDECSDSTVSAGFKLEVLLIVQGQLVYGKLLISWE